MNKIMELADRLMTGYPTPGDSIAAAMELRRLAGVEAEREALKEENERLLAANLDCMEHYDDLRSELDRIRATEPVAWYEPALDGRSVSYFDGKPMIMVGKIGNEHHTVPLYTLKKP